MCGHSLSSSPLSLFFECFYRFLQEGIGNKKTETAIFGNKFDLAPLFNEYYITPFRGKGLPLTGVGEGTLQEEIDLINGRLELLGIARFQLYVSCGQVLTCRRGYRLRNKCLLTHTSRCG